MISDPDLDFTNEIVQGKQIGLGATNETARSQVSKDTKRADSEPSEARRAVRLAVDYKRPVVNEQLDKG